MIKRIFFVMLLFSNICFSYTTKKMEKEANNIFIPITKVTVESKLNNSITREFVDKNVVYKLKNKVANDVIPVLMGINNVKVKGIDDFLILSGKQKDVEDIKDLIEQIDIMKKQVLVKLNIIDTSKNLFDRIGFNWKFNSNFSIIGAVSDFLAGNLSFTNLLRNSSKIFDVNIDALKEKGEIVLKSSPNILVVDGNKGMFKVTDETVLIVKGDKKENAMSREAGIILEVLPKIKQNLDTNYVEVKIKAEISNFKSRETKKQNVIETVVNVEDKKSIFIGGTTNLVTDKTTSKTPILGDIPIIGSLFKYKSKANVQREVYMELEVGII